MTLIFSKDSSLFKKLNRLFIHIEKNLWIGHATIRELESFKIMVSSGNFNNTMIFKISKEDFSKYSKKCVDFLSEI